MHLPARREKKNLKGKVGREIQTKKNPFLKCWKCEHADSWDGPQEKQFSIQEMWVLNL